MIGPRHIKCSVGAIISLQSLYLPYLLVMAVQYVHVGIGQPFMHHYLVSFIGIVVKAAGDGENEGKEKISLKLLPPRHHASILHFVLYTYY